MLNTNFSQRGTKNKMASEQTATRSAPQIDFAKCPVNFILFLSYSTQFETWRLLTLKTSGAHFRKACSWPHISSPWESFRRRSPPSSPRRLSTYLPKAQKLGYALDPRANTANLDKENTIIQFFTLHYITFRYPWLKVSLINPLTMDYRLTGSQKYISDGFTAMRCSAYLDRR